MDVANIISLIVLSLILVLELFLKQLRFKYHKCQIFIRWIIFLSEILIFHDLRLKLGTIFSENNSNLFIIQLVFQIDYFVTMMKVPIYVTFL